MVFNIKFYSNQSQIEPIRHRRRSRIQERDLLFQKIEQRIEDIRKTTDFYKKEQSREFLKELKTSLRNEEDNRSESEYSVQSPVKMNKSKGILPVLKKRYSVGEKAREMSSVYSFSASKVDNCVSQYSSLKNEVFKPYKPERKYRKHEISSQVNAFDMFKDESLLEHHKMMQSWKNKNLKEKILKYGGLYPGTFADEFGKPHFDKENRVSLLLYSQYTNLKNKFRSENMK